MCFSRSQPFAGQHEVRTGKDDASSLQPGCITNHRHALKAL
jgi:hypothetical protein